MKDQTRSTVIEIGLTGVIGAATLACMIVAGNDTTAPDLFTRVSRCLQPAVPATTQLSLQAITAAGETLQAPQATDARIGAAATAKSELPSMRFSAAGYIVATGSDGMPRRTAFAMLPGESNPTVAPDGEAPDALTLKEKQAFAKQLDRCNLSLLHSRTKTVARQTIALDYN